MTKEPQYSFMFSPERVKNRQSLGLMNSEVWNRDPKRLAFVLARYKFVAKVFTGMNHVLEVGCGDGWASRVVSQSVHNHYLSDFDENFISEINSRSSSLWPTNNFVHDFTKKTLKMKFDGIYLLDVFEHIKKSNERKFLKNILNSLKANGILIIGIPSLESQKHIPPKLRDPGHVNCKNGEELKLTLSKFFDRIIMFSMNDEVIHTGNFLMAHYLIAICTHKKN